MKHDEIWNVTYFIYFNKNCTIITSCVISLMKSVDWNLNIVCVRDVRILNFKWSLHLAISQKRWFPSWGKYFVAFLLRLILLLLHLHLPIIVKLKQSHSIFFILSRNNLPIISVDSLWTSLMDFRIVYNNSEHRAHLERLM